jgi:putative ABC transport system permease protein
VGSLGLMNTMYMAVIERTREIGIYSSLGASSRIVLTLFIFEAAFLGFLGGSLGYILGFGFASNIAALISPALNSASLIISPDFSLLGISIALSMILGIISGLMPARRAALIAPVSALRYE